MMLGGKAKRISLPAECSTTPGSSRMGGRHANQTSKPHRRPKGDVADAILDAAIALAEEADWEKVRLRIVAERIGCSLADVGEHYRDLDQVADAWFGRARMAMLAPFPKDFPGRPAEERVFIVMMRWFDALAAHRVVTCDMLKAKIYPSHPHHWVPLVFNLSRIIQWVREAALLDSTQRRRQVEEIGLTGLFVLTLGVWRRDDTPGQKKTRQFLHQRLHSCDRLMTFLF
jgi:AcrR family transcriptional regulator